jgi:MFS family permease
MTCVAASVPISEIGERSSSSPRAVTVFGIVTAITFSASSAAPTPLYRLYQQGFDLSPLLLTVIFAAYAFSLLGALLTVGSLSDYVGRRPVIFAALLLNVVALFMFIEAHSAAALIAARVVQGFATGAATTTLAAAILDGNRAQGPLLNSITAFAGLTLGALGSGALVTFAPHPAQLVYVVLLAASALEALVLWQLPETTAGRPGALASLRPQVSVPPQARQTLMRVTPVNIATWALGGFYFSLMPSLVRVATGLASPFIGGLVVAALTFTAAVSVVLFRKQPAAATLAAGTVTLASGVVITLIGVHAQEAALLLLGTVAAGFGFGAAFSGTLRTVLPLATACQRAGLLSTFYVESYLAFSLPAILAGLLAPVLGLPVSAYIYGTAIILLAVTSFVAARASRAQ